MTFSCFSIDVCICLHSDSHFSTQRNCFSISYIPINTSKARDAATMLKLGRSWSDHLSMDVEATFHNMEERWDINIIIDILINYPYINCYIIFHSTLSVKQPNMSLLYFMNNILKMLWREQREAMQPGASEAQDVCRGLSLPVYSGLASNMILPQLLDVLKPQSKTAEVKP